MEPSENRLRGTVTAAAWDEIYLRLTVALPAGAAAEGLSFYAVNETGRACAQWETAPASNGGLLLSLNITNVGTKRCLPPGRYKLALCDGGRFCGYCGGGAHPEANRDFPYGSQGMVYAMGFSAGPGDDFVMQVRDSGAAQKAGLKTRLRNHLFQTLYRREAKRADDRQHTVLFLAEHGETLPGNLQAVKEQMETRGMDGTYRLTVSARDAFLAPQSLGSWMELVRKAAQSGIIFIDDYVSLFNAVTLSPDTRLIQLWHAGAGFKATGYARWGHKKAPNPVSCFRQVTYGIAGSEKIARFFSDVWGINPENVLPTGMPRMDRYLDPAHRAETERALREQYPMINGKRVVLFAPTYRGKGQRDAGYPYEKIDFRRLFDLCGEDTVVLFKMHPWVREPVPIPPECRSRMADLNRYPDINDLFYITDVLVGDYSSNIFEFSLMEKPMLFFAFDLEEYGAGRGFHRDFESAVPGKVCRTFDQLLTALEQEDYQAEKLAPYLERHFDHVDAHAADRVIDWLVLDRMPPEYRARIDARAREIRHWRSLSFPSF